MVQNISVDDELNEYTRSIARHEIGHFASAIKLGFDCDYVSFAVHHVGKHYGGASLNLFKSVGSIENLKEYLKDRMVVLCSGAISETAHCENGKWKIDSTAAIKNFESENSGSRGDFMKYREVLQILSNLSIETDDTPKEEIEELLQKIGKEVWDTALRLVKQLLETIVELADAMVDEQNVEVDGYYMTKGQLLNVRKIG